MASSKGFSLIELMITISILAIVVFIGVPGFQNMLGASRESASRESLFSALQLARGEAVTRGTQVTVCQRNAGATACDNDSSWGQGWMVVTAGGEVLQAWDPLNGGAALAVAGGADSVVYQPDGGIQGVARTFTLSVNGNDACFRLGLTGSMSSVGCP